MNHCPVVRPREENATTKTSRVKTSQKTSENDWMSHPSMVFLLASEHPVGPFDIAPSLRHAVFHFWKCLGKKGNTSHSCLEDTSSSISCGQWSMVVSSQGSRAFCLDVECEVWSQRALNEYLMTATSLLMCFNHLFKFGRNYVFQSFNLVSLK